MPDAELIELLRKAADAIDEEAAFCVDVDQDDHGRSKPSIPRADQPYYEAVTETAQAIRELVAMVQARQPR